MNSSVDRKKVKVLPTTCLFGRLRLLNRMVNAVFKSVEGEFNINISQLSILIGVAYLGDTTSKAICDLLKMDTSTFSRSLAILKKNGWLDSQPSGEGKILSVVLTRQGEEKIEEIYPAWQQAQEKAVELLGEPLAREIQKAGTRKYLQR